MSRIPFHAAYSICLLLFLQNSPVIAQGTGAGRIGLEYTVSHSDTLHRPFPDSITLQGQFIREGEFSAVTADGDTLLPDVDYTLNRRTGILRILPGFSAGRDSLQLPAVVLTYTALPFSFQSVYRKRTLLAQIDTTTGDTLQVSAPSAPMNLESIFGSDLQKSGYIGRGFTVGSNRDLSLNSGFRLQLSGPLTDEISLVAALTDENTPIQPEGNTKTLQELDKVFIKLSSPEYAVTLGDFSIAFTGTEFAPYNRKLAGVMAEAALPGVSASAAFASMKGSFRSMQFNGIDGVQGPYRLSGKNGEQRILVLAGTERVYIDGVLMERGETADYTIEYASGEIYFQPRRLITSYSRIVVDFEYSDREYVRTMLAGGGAGTFLGDRLRVSARYFRESDDKDSPIDIQLNDSDKQILERAGDTTGSASVSGVVYAGIDTSRGKGAGTYVRIDTLIGGTQYVVYRYQPGADSATYAVSFSYVGAGQGDYTRKSLGYYEFAGVNLGDYAPVKLLPLPRLHQLADVAITVAPVRQVTFGAEIGISDLDANLFSAADDDNNTGFAYLFTLGGAFDSTSIGRLSASAKFRSQEAEFVPIDRINDIEFARKWDIASYSTATETTREAQAAYSPAQQLTLSGGIGSYTRGKFSSQRSEAGFQTRQDTSYLWLPQTQYRLEYIASDSRDRNIQGSWLRQQGEIRYSTATVIPFVTVEQERKENTAQGQDSLLAGSLAFYDVRPGLEFPGIGPLDVRVNGGFRVEDALLNGSLQRLSKDLLEQFTLSLRKWNDLSGSASLTVRDRTYTDAFAALGNNNLQSILTKVQLQYAPLKQAVKADLLYDVSTERTSKLERVFMPVPFGQGNYVYKGDLNANGIQDESEFEPTRYDGDYILVTQPTDELFPVIDLRSNLRIRFEPSRLFESSGKKGFWEETLSALGTETFFRIDEKSENDNTSDIYLLRLGTFLNDSTTVQGFQNVRQDVTLFEKSQDFSVRFRFDQNEGFNKYALTTERSYKKERSVRVRTQPVREIGIQSDLAFLTDNVRSSDANSNRARGITAASFKNDLSYRPERNVEVGFVLETKSATDSQYETPLEASINAQTVRTTISFPGPGRLRIELERNEVVFSTKTDRFPFELTDGKPEGKSWVWRLNFDYRITSYLQATAYYLGRIESGRNAIHTARAEVRAFF